MGFFGFMRDVHDRHERLKHRVHSYRLPLSPRGRFLMGCVYFSLPIILGYNIMQFTNRQAQENVGARGEKMQTDAAQARAIREQNKGLQAILDKAREKKEGKKPSQ